MKKNYILSLLLVFFVTSSIFGAKPTLKRATPSKKTYTNPQFVKSKVNNENITILLTEDFSKFTLGTDAVPDSLDISDAETGEIPATYTLTGGWSGWGVQQAGGTAYMGWVNYSEYIDSEDGPGYIVTPLFNAAPAIDGYSIKFKAKSTLAAGDTLYVYSNYGDGEYDEHIIEITNQWAEYTVSAETGDATSYVDIYGTASEFYLDDVEVSYVGGNGGNPGGGNDVFYETFGEAGPTSNPRAKITEYTDYDNAAPVVFSVSTTDLPDIRATSTLNSHVWFPVAKATDLVISNIPATGYTDLKLSFDVAPNASGTNIALANVNKVMLEVNDVAVTVPSVAFTAQNVYVNSGEIALSPANSVKLRFYYTLENNPTNFGYRLDNIKITGTPPTGIIANNTQKLNLWVRNGKITFEAAYGEKVEIFNTVGQKILSQTTAEGKNEINVNHKGLTIIKVGNRTGKVIL